MDTQEWLFAPERPTTGWAAQHLPTMRVVAFLEVGAMAKEAVEGAVDVGNGPPEQAH
jgi:hypothetical protein